MATDTDNLRERVARAIADSGPIPGEVFASDMDAAAAALAAVAEAPGLVEEVRVILACGAYQMPGDGRPYETQADAVANAVRAWLRGEA